MATGVPTDLYDRDTLVVRSRDFNHRWVNPTNELTRLAQAGIVRSVSHQPGCESAYQAGKPIFDPLIAGGKALTGPMEKAMCGENRHS